MEAQRAEGQPAGRLRQLSAAPPAPGQAGGVRRASFRSVLQRLGGSETRIPRSFGGWKNSFRCERARADLLFLICDDVAAASAIRVPRQIVEAATQLGYVVRVEQVERQEDTGGRDVFAIRELERRTFGVSELRR